MKCYIILPYISDNQYVVRTTYESSVVSALIISTSPVCLHIWCSVIYTRVYVCMYVCTSRTLCYAMWCSASEQWLALVLQLKPAPTLTNYPHTSNPGRTHARTLPADLCRSLYWLCQRWTAGTRSLWIVRSSLRFQNKITYQRNNK